MYIILIIVIIILIIINIIQFKINKENKLIIEDLEYENKKLLDKELTSNKEDKIPITEISNKEESPKLPQEEPKKIKELPPVEKIINNQQTSPIEVPKSIPVSSFDLDNYINKNYKIIPNKKDSYIEELSKELSKDTSKNIITLTDYEKEEEENAIISYQELINNNQSKEDTKLFIENLKKLRDSLK